MWMKDNTSKKMTGLTFLILVSARHLPHYKLKTQGN